jgi:hypothetical protein
MRPYPVHFELGPPGPFTRLQLAVRLLAFMVLGLFGVSLGAVYVALYFGLPAFAAVRLVSQADPAGYLGEDGPRVVRGLRWLAAVLAWFGLVVDRLPERAPAETVRIEVTPTGRPTPVGALWRVLYGLPSALVLALLGCVGGLVWLWAAFTVLVVGRVGPVAFAYLAGLQRWGLRLLAYQAALVEEYPPFSLGEPPAAALPTAEPSRMT